LAPAFDHQAGYTGALSGIEEFGERDAAAIAGREHPELEALRGRPMVEVLGFKRGNGDRAHLQRGEQLRGGGHAAAAVGDDAKRLTLRRRIEARGEQRIVRDDGFRANDDRVMVGAEMVDFGAGGLARDPFALAIRQRDAAVERCRELQRYGRPRERRRIAHSGLPSASFAICAATKAAKSAGVLKSL
jgi:hypothetical protein